MQTNGCTHNKNARNFAFFWRPLTAGNHVESHHINEIFNHTMLSIAIKDNSEYLKQETHLLRQNQQVLCPRISIF